jgi:MoxR-like ATPase
MNAELKNQVDQILLRAKSVIFGQDELLEGIMAALICEGHLLIEGMPGLGKTLSVSAMSKLCSLNFKRIQFTPDLLPSDLIGTMIYSQANEEFKTKFGPIFTQLLLTDEINRSPAKVQSALLEAMAEKQVTIGDKTHKLSSPFVVLATQNPIEQEGTYQLPEAQLDRFMMKILVDYPDFQAEKSILDLRKDSLQELKPILSTNDIQALQEAVNGIYVDEKIKDMVVRMVHATRPGNKYFLRQFDGAILAGASPRACLWLYKIAKYKAFRQGKEFVTPEHILQIVPSVLGHRVILSYEANIDKMNVRDVVLKIANSVV